ncbi:MAG: glycosyltransferase family 39 protein [Verrucomicrobia bacterium]|nr:glycosyltransferase family 39 protein [Verrucomicrobiota bacterium]
MPVFGFLPLISLLLVCLAIFRRRSASGDPDSAQYAFLSGSTLWGALLVIATEAFSLVEGLTFLSLLVFWTTAAIVSAAFYVAALKKYPPQPRQPRPRYSPGQMLLLAAILAITATIGSIAFIAPPNTWDSMDYHMPRVLYWIQNHTVHFYPTHCARQNQMGPGAAYVVMHLQLLSGSDRFANFVQWYAMIGCMVASAFLCSRFGLGRKVGLCSALFIATIPMGTLEASSTYVDYVAAFWVMSFACFTSRPDEPGREDAFSHLLPGLSLGLAILTKATAYLFALPFLIWFVMLEIRRRRLAAAAPLAACAALTLLLNAGHYARCSDLYGNPLGIEVNIIDRDKNITEKHSNDIFTPKALLSNLIRNTATHFQMTHSVTVNLAVEDAVIRLHELMGADVNDRRTTWEKQVFRSHANQRVLKDAGARRNYRSDEGVSNPLHFLLIVLALGIILGGKVLRRKEGLLVYALCCVAGFLLFCGYLKWQPWHSRLHLPVFVFSAPFVAAALFNSMDSRFGALWRAVSMIILTGMTVPTLLYSCERPLLGEHNMLPKTRHERFFWFPHRKEPFVKAQEFLKNQKVNAIGFVGADWEYPMMMLLKEDHPHVRFLSVNVTDRSKMKHELKPFRDFRPDAIIALQRVNAKHIAPVLAHQGRVFHLRSQEGYIAVYLPTTEQKKE